MAVAYRALFLVGAVIGAASVMADPWEWWLAEYRGRLEAAAPSVRSMKARPAPEVISPAPAARPRPAERPDTVRRVKDVVRSVRVAREAHPLTFAADLRGHRIAFTGSVRFTDSIRTLVTSSEWFPAQRVNCRFPRAEQESLTVYQPITAVGTFRDLTRQGRGATLHLDDCRLLPAAG